MCPWFIFLIPTHILREEDVEGVRMAMRRWTSKLAQWTTDMLQLPQDVIMDYPRITMIGTIQIYIENHRGIVHFDHDCIKVAWAHGCMEIRGQQLTIRSIQKEVVFVEGQIREVKYL
jgi:sporulation protein YqfC